MGLLAMGDSPESCPLSVAGAILTTAWLRYPVFDVETEELLRLAEAVVKDLSLTEIFATEHALLDMLDDISSTYQAFIIDSGALYEDMRPESEKASAVDYTRLSSRSGNHTYVIKYAVARWPPLWAPL